MHIPSLDPMLIPHAELDTGASFKAIFDNIRIYGLTKFVLKNVTLDIKNNVVDVDLVFPLINTVADYSMKGRILILQLNGFGKCEGNYSECFVVKVLFFFTRTFVVANLQTRSVISGHRVIKKGKEHINFDKIVLDLHFGEQNSLAFENIFRGNKELTDQTNKIISENIEGIMMEVKPVFDETVAQIVLGVLRGVFDRYSLDDLFPNI